MKPVIIKSSDLAASIREALQFISYYHPADFIDHLTQAYHKEESPAAKDALGQILKNSRMAAIGHRPMCQDTGMVTVFLRIGQEVLFTGKRALIDVINSAVRSAYRDEANPLRASMVRDPIFDRSNTRDNAPAVVHFELTPGRQVDIAVVAKGGGSENKAQFANLIPGASVSDWVVNTVSKLGAGWCPPGILGIGVGGSGEKAMLLAKQSLLEDIDMSSLLERGPSTPEEKLRVEIYERVNALGIGAQGLGGLTTIVDVKLKTFSTHAASVPVAMVPQCAANRHIHFTLDGSGPAMFETPDLNRWPVIGETTGMVAPRHVDLNALSRADVAEWRAGETLLLSGRLLTGRDAAHGRLAAMTAARQPLPVSLRDRALYYVGPVDPTGAEVVGPAGPTTSSRMDQYSELMLGDLGLLVMIGKAERNAATVEAIKRHGAAYLIAVGGAAYLISKAIKSARKVAFKDLGMEAIYELEVENMPVTVAVDSTGQSIHLLGPSTWRDVMVRRKAKASA